jgi:hypothetical protein
MKHPSTSSCLINTLENFFDFIKWHKPLQINVTKDMMIDYAGLDNNYGFPKL